ncbi:Nn.00g103160.m01.CDS01 [Neocucurbitaria sp. VM-36]
MFFLNLILAINSLVVCPFEGAIDSTTARHQTMASARVDQRKASVKQSNSTFPNVSTNSGYASEDDDTPSELPADRAILEAEQDGRIPITALQMSFFFNMIMFSYIVSPALLVFPLVIFTGTISLIYYLGGIDRSHIRFADFPGFRLVWTTTIAINQEKVIPVPHEKCIAPYIIKGNKVDDRTVPKGNTSVPHSIAPSSNHDNRSTSNLFMEPVLHSKPGLTKDTVIIIASKYMLQFQKQVVMIQWLAETCPDSPYFQTEVRSKDDMLQWLMDFSTLDLPNDFRETTPYGYVHRRLKPIRDEIVTEFDRSSYTITTFASLVQDFVQDWENNPTYLELPSALPGSLAACETSYDRGFSIESECPPLQAVIELGETRRWYETLSRNVYIDVWEPGRWAIFDGTGYYVIRWLQKQQIWFCMEWGFGFCSEDDGQLHMIQGLDPEHEEHMTGPKVWQPNQGPQGPFYDAALTALLQEHNHSLQQESAAQQMRYEIEEQKWRDAEELRLQEEREKARHEAEIAQKQEEQQKKRKEAEQVKETDCLRLHKEARTRPKATAQPEGRPRRAQPQSNRAQNNEKAPDSSNMFQDFLRAQGQTGLQKEFNVSSQKSLEEIRAANKLKAEQQMKEWETKSFAKEKAEFGKKFSWAD